MGTIALYILLSNIIGIFGLVPPTKDINVTAALAVMSAFLIYGAQFRYRGLRGGLKQFAKPMPLLFPINLMEIIIRPLALCMRLFGNILGAFIIMELIKLICPGRWCLYPSASTLTCLTAPSRQCSCIFDRAVYRRRNSGRGVNGPCRRSQFKEEIVPWKSECLRSECLL